MGLFEIPHILDVLIKNRCHSSLIAVVVEGVVGGGVGGERGGRGVAVGLGMGGRHDRRQDGQGQQGLGGEEEGEVRCKVQTRGQRYN